MNRRSFFTAACGAAVAAAAVVRPKAKEPTIPSVVIRPRHTMHVNMLPSVAGDTFVICQNGVPVTYLLQHWEGFQSS